MDTLEPGTAGVRPSQPLDAAAALGSDWMSPTQALTRFQLPEGVALRQQTSAVAEVRYGFRVGSLNLLVKRRTVSEVIPAASIASIPNGPPWLLGMINLRSNLVPVFDLAMICSVEQKVQERQILVIDKGDHAVGLVADGYPKSLAEMTPVRHLPSLPTALRGAVAAGYMANDELWLEFDHRQFFSALSGAQDG